VCVACWVFSLLNREFEPGGGAGAENFHGGPPDGLSSGDQELTNARGRFRARAEASALEIRQMGSADADKISHIQLSKAVATSLMIESLPDTKREASATPREHVQARNG
jgi:hypothetical protein